MYQQHTLNNGLQILLIPVQTFQSVSAGAFVRVGSRYETEELAGMSHFIEHMVFKGTQKRPRPRLIAEAIEGIGGVNNAYTSQETTVYYARVAATHAATALDFLADLVRNPLFEAGEIGKERQVIDEEISMVYDMPDAWVSILADAMLWPDHPLGQNVAGTPDSLLNINRDTLLPFFAQTYHPRNLLFAVAGAFEPETVIAQLDHLLGDWAAGPLPNFAPALPPPAAPAAYVEHRPIEQGHLCLTMPGLPRSHPDRYALSVLNTVLGDGMSSRLFQNIREERGLAYAVDSGLSLLQDTGSMTIYAGVDPAGSPEALQAILDELDCLRQEIVPPQELNKAREYLKGRLVLGLEDSYSRAAWVAYQALYMDAIKSPEEVLAAYDAVTAADVQRLAQQIFQPDAYCLAAVGPFGHGESLTHLIQGSNLS